jgi:predicted NUDIX family phosphoesterase
VTSPAEEHVLVVPRAAVVVRPWHGVRTTDLHATLDVIRSTGRFEPRSAMEQDPGYKQVIPYLVLRDGPRWFLMRRTRAGGDARLHDRWSIGVGGHVNPGDRDLEGGLRREWREEIQADFEPEFALVGLLNDDETPVGAVHLGVVFLADAAGRAVAVRETDKLEGAFAIEAEVEAVQDRMETWSAIVFDVLRTAAADRPTGVPIIPPRAPCQTDASSLA